MIFGVLVIKASEDKMEKKEKKNIFRSNINVHVNEEYYTELCVCVNV